MSTMLVKKLPIYLQEQIDQDLHDPIALQYVRSDHEDLPDPQALRDPIGDEAKSKSKLIIHRYPDRVLFLPTDHCAVYCRFCFRKDRVGQGGAVADDKDIDEALAYLRENENIWEVIFSGGDPLILSPRRLENLIEKINTIPHISVIRFHTRLPVVDPKRVTPELVKALTSSKATYLAVHVNHPDELTDDAVTALKSLHQAGINLISQTVLLKGINNNAKILEKLFRNLVAHNVKPYYLHHPDLVHGTAHFRVEMEEGMSLMKELRGKISGLCWPTYVLDIPGGYGKVPINDSYVRRLNADKWHVEDIHGCHHIYPPPHKKDKVHE